MLKDFFWASWDQGGFGNLMFPLWFALLGGSFDFLFLVFHLFGVLWFIYDWHHFFWHKCPLEEKGTYVGLQVTHSPL
jgi:hypothetical protein